MADSDEEHERGRRDKFRRERSDYGEKGSRSRSDHRERRSSLYRDEHDSGGRRRGRDDMEDDRERRPHRWGSPPPSKRLRRDGWEGLHDFRGMGMMRPYGIRPHPWGPPRGMPPGPPLPPGAMLPGEPPRGMGPSHRHAMMSFKQFLSQEDDSIDEVVAIQKYNEYKLEFKSKQISEFFEDHKEEDWFLSKYHPRCTRAEHEAAALYLQARLQAFLFLLELQRLDTVPLDQEYADAIIKIMDAAVIKMEGGEEVDMLALERPPEDKQEAEEGEEKEEVATKKVAETEGVEKEEEEGRAKDGGEPSFVVPELTEEQKKLTEQARQYGQQMEGGKVKTYAYAEESVSESEESNTNEPQPPPPGVDASPPSGAAAHSEGAVPETGQTEEQFNGHTEPGGGGGEGEQAPGDEGDATSALASPPSRALHLTRSVYIRHIPAKISTENIVEVCRTIPGYLRIALADPAPDKGYERRGWVTYTNETDIRDVTARLSTNKIKECQLSCMVNRELSRRVKPCSSPFVWARKAVYTDLHLALRLTHALDEQRELWQYSKVQPATGEGGVVEDEPEYNPVVSLPPDVLAEDEEPMAGVGEEEEGVVVDPGTEVCSNEDDKIKALDRLIWYLRVVHSVDFYNATVFPSEDCMPHRCGIISARPVKPTAVTQEQVAKYVESMEAKVKPLMAKKTELTEDEMEKFGKKDPEAEAERFIEMNTQKLSENKYLCPLSGKKFKGPDFVRKHIFNKHVDKVDEMRQEADFFNNFLRDTERPMPDDATVSTPFSPLAAASNPGGRGNEAGASSGGAGVASIGGAWGQSAQMMMFGSGGLRPGFPPMMNRGGGNFRTPRGGRRGRGGRRMVNYHDLDAPSQDDMY